MCDVIVIGAGPSGSAATFFIASHGLSVTCIERLDDARFERYHTMCGECISEKGLNVIGVKDDEIRNRVNRFRIDWPGGVRTEFKVRGYIINRVDVISRLHRDSESLGATFVKGTVKSVEQDSSGCAVTLSDGCVLTSRYVIGADGACSVTRRCIFGSEPERKIPVGICISDDQVEDDVITFKLNGQGRFYTWSFPSGKGSSIGGLNKHFKPVEGFHGARPIPIGWVEQFVNGNVALVGDAGGFVNPVSFGGLRVAFETAKHAADAVASGNLGVYDRWWRKSPLSDRRFMKVCKEFAGYSDEEYSDFAEHLGHGLYTGGFLSLVSHPRKAWLYFGCLFSLRNGW